MNYASTGNIILINVKEKFAVGTGHQNTYKSIKLNVI